MDREDEEDEEEGDVDGDDVSLTKAEDYPIMDTSVLPEYLRPYCEGKGVYWLERGTTGNTDGNVLKYFCVCNK